MNYSKYHEIAKNKISQYGSEIVIIRKLDEVYNENTNEYEFTEERINGKAILSNFEFESENNSTVLRNDILLMCYFENGNPKISDEVIFANKTYNIVNIKELNPNGECSIYYKLQCR